jgi:hypothetical protein
MKRKLESDKTRVYAQKPRLRTLFKNSIPGVAASQLLLQGLLDHRPQAVRETLVQPAQHTALFFSSSGACCQCCGSVFI